MRGVYLMLPACLAIGACEPAEISSPTASVPDTWAVARDSVTDISGADDGDDADQASLDTLGDSPDTARPLVPLDPFDKKPVAHPCAKTLSPSFESNVRPHIQLCANCHNSTIPAAWMPHGGPQWFDPDNAQVTVDQLIQDELIDAENPDQSALVLKPLNRRDGGEKHGGGEHFALGSLADVGLRLFAHEAAKCLLE
jgi:hypothetical protein